MQELKSLESRSGKRKPIVTEVPVVVEDDKKFGGKMSWKRKGLMMKDIWFRY